MATKKQKFVFRANRCVDGDGCPSNATRAAWAEAAADRLAAALAEALAADAWADPPPPPCSRFYRFRRAFVSDGTPLALDVSADERFVLLLDGRPVARGPHHRLGNRMGGVVGQRGGPGKQGLLLAGGRALHALYL